MSKRVNARWAAKVLKAKYFVVLTDTESALALDGVDPDSINDMVALQSQTASIAAFKRDLTELEKVHKQHLQSLAKTGVSRATTKNNSTKKAATARKRTR